MYLCAELTAICGIPGKKAIIGSVLLCQEKSSLNRLFLGFPGFRSSASMRSSSPDRLCGSPDLVLDAQIGPVAAVPNS
jgi:hypothetical protein